MIREGLPHRHVHRPYNTLAGPVSQDSATLQRARMHRALEGKALHGRTGGFLGLEQGAAAYANDRVNSGGHWATVSGLETALSTSLRHTVFS